MDWLYIIGGVITAFAILLTCNEIRDRKKAKVLGLSLEDYRKQEQEKTKLENQKRRAKAEDAKFIAQYGMPKSEWLKQRGIEARRKAEALKEKQNILKMFDEQNGGATSSFHSILPDYSNREVDVRVYEKTQYVAILYNQVVVATIPFNSIISYRESEQKETLLDNAITTTTTNTGSMIGRGVVGGVLLGGVGALAGASTAKRSSETEFGSQKEVKSQFLSLTLNSLSIPNLTFYFGTDSTPQQAANYRKAISIFDIIVARNKASGKALTFDGQIDFKNIIDIKDCDPLFEDAARYVVTQQLASTTSIQRKLYIGFNRAGKIMDELEAAGIVGPVIGGNSRAVLVDEIELEQILNG